MPLGTLSTEGQIDTGTSLKTVLQLAAPSDRPVAVTGWGVSFSGTTANAGRVFTEVIYQSSAGTMTAASGPTSKPQGITLSTTGRKNATVEPSRAGQAIRNMLIDPEWGYTEFLPPENYIWLNPGQRIAVSVTSPTDVNAAAFFDFSE